MSDFERGYLLGNAQGLMIGGIVMPVGLASTIMGACGIALLVAYMILKFNHERKTNATKDNEA